MAKAVKNDPALFVDGELAPHPAPIAKQAYDLWNMAAEKNGWSKAEVLDPARQGALKRAVQTHGGIAGFRAALEKIERSDFCMGRVPGKDGRPAFKATLDWFLRPQTVRQVIENHYNRDSLVPIAITRQMDPDSEWGKRLRNYKVGGFWPSHWGKRPEEPGCQATPSILVAWRERNNITVTIPKPETRAEKLRGMIVSYRKVGNHGRANELEDELAKLEGRPPTLVPHPSAASLGMPEKAPVATMRAPPVVTDVEPFDEAPPWDSSDIPEGDPSQAEP